MIHITNNTKDFIEKEKGSIYLYGAGNAGYWIGYYMNLCRIAFEGYIDKNIEIDGITLNEHPIKPSSYLEKIKDQSVRLIITPKAYKEILSELLWMDHLWGLDCLCLIPIHKGIYQDEPTYNINYFLGYFRRQLFTGDTPTIISNTCIAGLIYESFNMPLLSPTINVGIDDDDFVKLCQNTKFYLSQEIRPLYWERNLRLNQRDEPNYVFELSDIKIKFAHIYNTSADEIIERWSLLCGRVNWERIYYVMEEQNFRKPLNNKTCVEFMNLKTKKLLFKTKYYNDYSSSDVVFSSDRHMMNRAEDIVENYFDLLEWMNS